MSLHSDTFFWFRANLSFFFFLKRLLSGKATNTNFIVFGLTRPGLEPTIYRTLGQHSNHYTSDALNKNEICFMTMNINTLMIRLTTEAFTKHSDIFLTLTLELTTLVVIGTDCTGSCISNSHTITTTTAPSLNKIYVKKIWIFNDMWMYCWRSSVISI
jgi:hypothetical protein